MESMPAHLGLEQGGEGLDGQQLVAQAAAEALHIGVLPGRAGLDVAGPSAGEAAPVTQDVGGQLWAIVTADEPRRRVPLGDQAVEHVHGGVGVDPAGDLDGKGFAGVLIDDVEQLQ